MSMRGSAGSMAAIVVANGVLPDLVLFGPLLDAADMIVAANGGARALMHAGRRPTAILGDLDSLPPDLLATWRAGGGETLVFPPEKDETDLELALVPDRFDFAMPATRAARCVRLLMRRPG